MGAHVTPDAWLAARSPVPPLAIAQRMRDVLGSRLTAPVSDVADVFLSAGEGLVSLLLIKGRTTRETALDLLCADAFVTYAFEAASADPDRVQGRAERAMARISRLAAAPAA